MSQKLNYFEQSVLPIFRSLTKYNLSEDKIKNWMISEEQRLGFVYGQVNWLKIAICSDSEKMVDFVFKDINEKEINEAMIFIYDNQQLKTFNYAKDKVKHFFHHQLLLNEKIQELRLLFSQNKNSLIKKY